MRINHGSMRVYSRCSKRTGSNTPGAPVWRASRVLLGQQVAHLCRKRGPALKRGVVHNVIHGQLNAIRPSPAAYNYYPLLDDSVDMVAPPATREGGGQVLSLASHTGPVLHLFFRYALTQRAPEGVTPLDGGDGGPHG